LLKMKNNIEIYIIKLQMNRDQGIKLEVA
jgi:hypothetical protein